MYYIFSVPKCHPKGMASCETVLCQKISKVKSCMVYPKSDTKGIVSIYDSSYELVFNYDYMEIDKFDRDYTFYNTKDNLIMFVSL